MGAPVNRHGAVELDFADGTYTFRLGLREIEELEEKAKSGIFEIGKSLNPSVRTAWSKTISEAIRIGLIGGGMDAPRALVLVRRYVDERPMADSLLIAYSVVMAGLARVHGDKLTDPDEDELPGEGEAVKPDEPTLPPSTPPAP